MTLFAAAPAHFASWRKRRTKKIYFSVLFNLFSSSHLVFIQSHEITNLETFTQYLVSIQVFNPEGLGPSSTVLIMTDEGG